MLRERNCAIERRKGTARGGIEETGMGRGRP